MRTRFVPSSLDNRCGGILHRSPMFRSVYRWRGAPLRIPPESRANRKLFRVIRARCGKSRFLSPLACIVALPEMCRSVQFHFYDFRANQELVRASLEKGPNHFGKRSQPTLQLLSPFGSWRDVHRRTAVFGLRLSPFTSNSHPSRHAFKISLERRHLRGGVFQWQVRWRHVSHENPLPRVYVTTT